MRPAAWRARRAGADRATTETLPRSPGRVLTAGTPPRPAIDGWRQVSPHTIDLLIDAGYEYFGNGLDDIPTG
jgi:hypothetical protein